MLLMVLTGELAWEWKEPLSELALEEVDEADDDLRNEVRRLCREKRAVMDWKRGDCILTRDMFGCCGGSSLSEWVGG